MITITAPKQYAGPKLADGSDNPLYPLIVQASLWGLRLERHGEDQVRMAGFTDTEQFTVATMLAVSAVEGVEVAGYPVFAEVPAAKLDADIRAVVPGVLPVGEGETRAYRDMPTHVERDGRHFIALSYPNSPVAGASGLTYFRSGDVVAVRNDLGDSSILRPEDVPPPESLE